MKSEPGPAVPPNAAGVLAPRVTVTEAASSVGALTSDLIHALRNPVAALHTSVDLFVSGLADEEDTPKLHRVMRNELTRLSEMLSRCRDLTRIAHIAPIETDLAALVRARIEARAGEFVEHKIARSIAISDAKIPVMADATQLGDAFDGLLSNAIEAMPGGGELQIALEHDGARREAVLRIGDNGSGIAATALPNVFRLFYTTKKDAAGMGLPIARQVLFAHGAVITIASEQGRGTEVIARIPTC